MYKIYNRIDIDNTVLGCDQSDSIKPGKVPAGNATQVWRYGLAFIKTCF